MKLYPNRHMLENGGIRFTLGHSKQIVNPTAGHIVRMGAGDRYDIAGFAAWENKVAVQYPKEGG